ncbi:ABC transporter substrate-binding protein [Shewanella sp. UCD-KL12]|uniref:substrate-binding periplasmic protein n=1 Tax=Shewanella sp. UCD-KL12 TaxID=1917163 RepID=UPI00097101AE|nr:transporter substrate-binding domain-containing protein [Shewanella sp. UCD-KL12]
MGKCLAPFKFMLKALTLALILTVTVATCMLVSLNAQAAQVRAAVSSPELRLITEPWAPVSYEESGAAKGFAVELVEQLQLSVENEQQIEVMPWARALSIAETRANVLLFATSINETRRNKFHFVGPILSSKISLFALAEDEIEIERADELKTVGAIGVYRDTIGESLLKQAGVTNLQLASYPEHSAKQLFRGRVRLWCQADVAVASLLEKVGEQATSVKPVFVLDEIVLYLAFSKGTHQQVIEHWAEALTAFKTSGKFKRLYTKYFDDTHLSISVSDSVDILWLNH